MRILCVLLGGGLLWGMYAQDALPPARLNLRVVDAEGQPIPNAQVGALLMDYRRLALAPATEPFWQSTDAAGKCVPQWHQAHEPALREVWYGERRGGVIILVSAAGYQACAIDIGYPAPTDYTVTLAPAQPLEIKLYPAQAPPDDFGTNPPVRELTPLTEQLYRPLGELSVASQAELFQRVDLREDSSETYRYLKLCVGFGIERLSATHYRVWLPLDVQAPLVLCIQRPDWLQGYLARIDQEALTTRRVSFDLPSPGHLKLHIDLSQCSNWKASERRLIVRRTDYASLGVAWGQIFTIDSPTHEFTVMNLAPSQAWQASLHLFAREEFYQGAKPFRILPQETRTVRMRYEPFDPNRYKGTRQITLRLMRRDGKPAANVPLRVEMYIPEYARTVPVARARTDAQGRLRLQNLYELLQPLQDSAETPQYNVYLADEDTYEPIGEFRLVRGDGQQEILIFERLRVGDLAPDVELIDLRTGKTRRLSEFRGRYVLLDFWATWCMPCHRALERLKASWDALDPAQREQIQVVLVSINDDKTGVLEFLKQRGWDTLGELLWAGAGGWRSAVVDAYDVYSIPRYILLAPDGRVAVLNTQEPLEVVLELIQEAKREIGPSNARPN
ncbi:MAG: hypothetical protein KatS3mg016_1212 [Fimbriimonadales bacterium]|nr:MAG: hypothetical protein KatS3mg016_1212 [Fimbriimonadales bacterium]